MDNNFDEEIMQVPQSHSLQADMVTGWKPKLKIIGPMPLNFDNKYIDKTVKSIVNSDTSIYSAVYLGNHVFTKAPVPATPFKCIRFMRKSISTNTPT